MPLTLDGTGTISGVTDFTSSNIELTDPEITGGVYLGGTGSANKLEDYEEGTWTPEWSFSGGGSVTIDSKLSATYTKIGNLVHLTCSYKLKGVSSPSGDAVLTGVPFTPLDTGGFQIGQGISLGELRRWATDFGGNLVARVIGSEVIFQKNTSNSDRQRLQGSDFGSTSQIQFAITYTTAS